MLKNNIILIFTVFFFGNGCGVDMGDISTGLAYGRPPTDRRLLPLVREYENIIGERVNSSVVFGNPPQGGAHTAGVCIRAGRLGVGLVMVSEAFIGAPLDRLRLIVWHELLHCERGRGHDLTMVLYKKNTLEIENSFTNVRSLYGRLVPLSIMFPSDGFHQEFALTKERYIEEMKNPGKISDDAIAIYSFNTVDEALEKRFIVIEEVNHPAQP